MKILIASMYDWAGMAQNSANALRLIGHDVTQVVMRPHPSFSYPYDRCGMDMTTEDLATLLNGADVWNLYDDVWSEWLHVFDQHGVPHKPVVNSYYGSWYRAQWQEINERARLLGWKQACMSQDLSLLGPTWVSFPEPDRGGQWLPNAKFTVIHAPSIRARKGTAMLLEALDGLDGIFLDLVEGTSNEKCLERKRHAHVLVDQVGPAGFGYGCNATEAWSMNLPVISSAPLDVRDQMCKLIGWVPFAHVEGVDDLRQTIIDMRDNPILREKWRSFGRVAYESFHKPSEAAKRLERLMGEAIEGFKGKGW